MSDRAKQIQADLATLRKLCGEGVIDGDFLYRVGRLLEDELRKATEWR